MKQVLNDADNSCKAALEPIEAEMTSLNKRHDELHKAQEGKKADEIPQAEKDELSDVEKKLADEILNLHFENTIVISDKKQELMEENENVKR